MFWADELLKTRIGKELINDSFTPSGPVHMGSLKGPVIHDTLYRILKAQKKDAEFWYGFDDADPIDGLPSSLLKSHGKYLGVPLFLAPSPDGNGSFADFYISKMKNLLNQLGSHPKYYQTSELYKSGKFNQAIEFVLDHVQEIREVYAKIYKKEVSKNWYPLQVICPNCGKLGTTKVTKWDGKEISFSCDKNLVKWAEGCGVSDKISPFDGKAKMSWKIEWAAKWRTFGVTIEGAGKDHASAGGSYDVAMKLISEVFHAKPPLKLAYEFFLSGGKKMSSSKGLGLWGDQLLEVLAPEIVRFLMIKTPPNQAIEFIPSTTLIIPKLYDDYQHASNESSGNYRAFELSQISKEREVPKIRFLTLAQWVQMPNMEQKIKKEGLEKWAKYAKVWVEKYAPESEKFIVQTKLPEEAKNLSDLQKKFLQKVSSQLDKKWEAEKFQKELYEWAKEIELPSKDAFSAIYISFIGKDHGPKAGWLILSLDKEFVRKRFELTTKGMRAYN